MEKSENYKINTKYFGEIDIQANEVITFEQGLLGIEDYKKYTLFNMPENDKILCLQSVEEEQVAFLLIKPWDFFPDYEIDISDDELEKIKCNEVEQIVVFNIITLGEEIKQTTANLLAPIVVNINHNEAMQIIVNETNTKQSILYLIKKVKADVSPEKKKDESIMIGDNIKITILQCEDGNVKLGIDAPKNIKVHREEVLKEIINENKDAIKVNKDLIKDLGNIWK